MSIMRRVKKSRHLECDSYTHDKPNRVKKKIKGRKSYKINKEIECLTGDEIYLYGYDGFSEIDKVIGINKELDRANDYAGYDKYGYT